MVPEGTPLDDGAVLSLLKGLRSGEANPVGPHPDDAGMLAYVTGTLDAEAVAAFEQHVESCEACLAELELLVRVREGESDVPARDDAEEAAGRGDGRWSDVRASRRWKARQEALFDRVAEQLTDEDPARSEAAAAALASLDVDRLDDRLGLSAPLCSVALHHALPPVRAAAVRALGQYVVRDRDARRGALEAVRSALADDDADVRVAAIEALARLRPAGTAALAAVRRCLGDAEERCRSRAAAAIAAIERGVAATLDVSSWALTPAAGAGNIEHEGATLDGRLAYAVAERSDHTIELHFASRDPVLDGTRLRVRIGEGWFRDVPLAAVSSGRVEGFVTIPAHDRPGLADGDVLVILVDGENGAGT